MHRFGIILLGLSLVNSIYGCSSKKEGLPSHSVDAPKEIREEPAVLAWKVTLNSVCSDKEKEQCLAGFGFSVTADGKYELGPGPQGQVFLRKMEPADFQLMGEAVKNLLIPFQNENEPGEICTPHAQENSQDTVLLTRLGQERKILSTSENTTCFRTAALNEAELLLTVMKDLVKKYYFLPFPDLCRNAVSEVESIYPSVTACTQDADCAYIDAQFLHLPLEWQNYIVTDDCTLLQPLVVANKSLIQQFRSQLLSTKKKMLESCGSRIVRLGCTGIKGFYSSETKPLCIEGACHSGI